jgi:hypothetical protein
MSQIIQKVNETKQVNKLRHIVVRDKTYQQICQEGRFGESFDALLNRILSERIAKKQGELIVS